MPVRKNKGNIIEGHLEHSFKLNSLTFYFVMDRLVRPLDGSIAVGCAVDLNLELARTRANSEALERLVVMNKGGSSFSCRYADYGGTHNLVSPECFHYNWFEPGANFWGSPSDHIEWIETLELSCRKIYHLPLALYTPSVQTSFYSTNGCACCSDFETAVNNATAELVERDSLMRLWLQHPGQQVYLLDNDPAGYVLESVLEYFSARGMRLNVLSISCVSEQLITVIIFGWKTTQGPVQYCFGSGCCSSIAEAFHKAILEFIQLFILLYKEDLPQEIKAINSGWDQTLWWNMRGNLPRLKKSISKIMRQICPGGARHWQSSVPFNAHQFAQKHRLYLHVFPQESSLASSRYVVKVIAPSLFPLSFGSNLFLIPKDVGPTSLAPLDNIHPFV
jgi:hypothetical protein